MRGERRRGKSTGCGGRVLGEGARRWLPWIGGPINGACPDRPLQQVPQAWLGLVPGPQDLDRARKGGRMASERPRLGRHAARGRSCQGAVRALFVACVAAQPNQAAPRKRPGRSQGSSTAAQGPCRGRSWGVMGWPPCVRLGARPCRSRNTSVGPPPHARSGGGARTVSKPATARPKNRPATPGTKSGRPRVGLGKGLWGRGRAALEPNAAGWAAATASARPSGRTPPGVRPKRGLSRLFQVDRSSIPRRAGGRCGAVRGGQPNAAAAGEKSKAPNARHAHHKRAKGC